MNLKTSLQRYVENQYDANFLLKIFQNISIFLTIGFVSFDLKLLWHEKFQIETAFWSESLPFEEKSEI